MLREQKFVSGLTTPRGTRPMILLNQIDHEHQKLKMLINSFRDKTCKQDDSLFNDSDGSKHEVLSDNRSNKIEESRGRIRRQSGRPFGSPIAGLDHLGDTSLTNKRKNNSFFKKDFDLGRFNDKINALHSVNGYSQPQPKNTQISKQKAQIYHQSNFKSQSQIVNQKKQVLFRIKNKIEDKVNRMIPSFNKQTDQQTKTKDQQEFQVQSINTYLIVSHLQSIQSLDLNSNPQDIFAFFESIYRIAKFSPPKNTIIKRYKNCTYYGEKPKNEKQRYRGMFWYFKKTLYYGQMMNGKKHGLGIEISMANEVMVWKGKFQNGHKTGYFSIQSTEMKYYGHLKNGEFHGEGHLTINNSEYKGNFCEGLKEGNGWQKFTNKSEYKGQYFNNKFDGHGELKAGDYYYKGLLKCGKPDGYGFERTGQYEYLGNFQMGIKEGKGKIKTKDGLSIQGTFKNGLMVDENSPKHLKQPILQKNLSKELGALNEESDQGTIQNMLNEFVKR